MAKMQRWKKLVAGTALAGVIAVTSASSCGAEIAVGEPSALQAAMAPVPTLDELRKQYKRPESVPFPKNNSYTLAKAALGKSLYFDTRLSEAGLLSCASCHNPAYGWGDGQPKAVGNLMKPLSRRTPTIINSAFTRIFMWDGRAKSLEEQALVPIVADVEMALPLHDLLRRLQHIPQYEPLFDAAFPGQDITPDLIAKAIATYERTVISARAPFDDWVEGDDNAISTEAVRGFVLFNTKGQCSSCHVGWNFTDDGFHDTGLDSTDVGRGIFNQRNVKSQYAFKTPGLREIAHRGPFMHDGSIKTLEAVIEHYNRGGISRASRSDIVKPLGLSAAEKQELVTFLNTLTGEPNLTTIPILPH